MCKVDRCKWPSKRKVYLGFLRLLLRYIWQSYLLFFMTESVLINNITKPDFIFQTQAAFVLWSCLYFYFFKSKTPWRFMCRNRNRGEKLMSSSHSLFTRLDHCISSFFVQYVKWKFLVSLEMQACPICFSGSCLVRDVLLRQTCERMFWWSRHLRGHAMFDKSINGST